jgi:hypothetical protein
MEETCQKHIYEYYKVIWQEKTSTHGQLKIYAEIHPVNEISSWWLLARTNPDYMKQINDVLRLLCGSFKIKGKRVNKPETYRDYCDVCSSSFLNPVMHVHYCIVIAQANQERNYGNG